MRRPVIAPASVSAVAPLILTLAGSPAQAAGPAIPAANSNPGDAGPSLALSVNPGGKPEIATIGKNGSLWFAAQSQASWKRTQVGGAGSAGSGPSLIAEAGGAAIMAVEGPAHALEYYPLAGAAGRSLARQDHQRPRHHLLRPAAPAGGRLPSRPSPGVAWPARALLSEASGR